MTDTSNEHTPGPWIANYRRVTPANGRQDGQDDICHVYGDESRERANASLIAAAPDMLAALRRIRSDLIRQYSIYVYNANFSYLDDAIQKAGGDSHDWCAKSTCPKCSARWEDGQRP